MQEKHLVFQVRFPLSVMMLVAVQIRPLSSIGMLLTPEGYVFCCQVRSISYQYQVKPNIPIKLRLVDYWQCRSCNMDGSCSNNDLLNGTLLPVVLLHLASWLGTGWYSEGY